MVRSTGSRYITEMHAHVKRNSVKSNQIGNNVTVTYSGTGIVLFTKGISYISLYWRFKLLLHKILVMSVKLAAS